MNIGIERQQQLKYGEREVDLAVDNWLHVTNITEENLESSKELAQKTADRLRAPSFETHIEEVAYKLDGNLVLGLFGIYIRGAPIIPRVNRIVVLEAGEYLRKPEIRQLEFLALLHHTVVKTKKGRYATRLRRQQDGIAATLNYFADKMRPEDETRARELELAVLRAF